MSQNIKKGLININNNGNKGFLWFHTRYLNFVRRNPQRITKNIKK